MRVSLATEMAPPFVLVAHFFIAAVIFLLLSAVSLTSLGNALVGYYISSTLASFSHLYLLGFVMMVIFGAMYQLLPVVLEIPLFSKDFAYVQFYLYVIGLSMMVLGLYDGTYHLLIPYGGFATYLSMLIFCCNVLLTFLRLKRFNTVSLFLLIATLFLLISVTIGMVLGMNLGHGILSIDMDAWIKAHMLGTLGGFVMMIIMGVSMVLIPMFSLAHNFSDRYIKLAFGIHCFGMSLGMVSLLLSLPAFIVNFSLGAVILSTTLYLAQMKTIFQHRVRKQNDYWVKNLFFGFVSLSLSLIIFGCSRVVDNVDLVFVGAILFFFGFLLAFVVGHLYKILPFLIWYQKFSPLVGKQKVPLLHEMVQTKLADTQAFMLFVSVLGLCFAVFLHINVLWKISVLGFIVAIILVAVNVAYGFRYQVKDNV